MADTTDWDVLATRLAADLDGAFADFVRASQHGLYAGALRMTGDAADAEDVAQEALVRAYRALGRYPPQQIAGLRLRGWVWTIAANLCRSRIRTRQRRPSRALEGVDPADPGPGPEALAMNGDTRDRIASHVLELIWPQRAAVVLRHVVGLGYAEIAESLGRPVGTVKADVHRGLARLRAALEEEETP